MAQKKPWCSRCRRKLTRKNPGQWVYTLERGQEWVCQDFYYCQFKKRWKKRK